MTQEGKGKRKIPPVAPTYTGADDLFKLKKPVDPPSTQQESEPMMQPESTVEEKRGSEQEGQQNEAPENRLHVTTTSQSSVRDVPHVGSISSSNLAGQNTEMQVAPPFGQASEIPLKKPKQPPAPRPNNQVVQQPSSQVVQRQITKVTIEIYEDQRRAIEAMYIDRVNALIDSGVQVDRRKYQESVIYREFLEIAIAVVRQQRSKE